MPTTSRPRPRLATIGLLVALVLLAAVPSAAADDHNDPWPYVLCEQVTGIDCGDLVEELCPGGDCHPCDGDIPERCEVPCVTRRCAHIGCHLPGGEVPCFDSICEAGAWLGVGAGPTPDCTDRICALEEQVGRDLVHTSDRDGDGVEDCHDPDIDGDGISNTLEEAIGYNPGSKQSDGDGIPDAFDLIPGRDANVKVWVRIVEIQGGVDWEDFPTKPDPYLKSTAGLSIDGSIPKEANRLSFDGLRLGSHIHDLQPDETVIFEEGAPQDDYAEVAGDFPQRWHPTDYPRLEGGGKLELEWELPLWDHDGHPNLEGDDPDGEGTDDRATSLDTSDVILQLLKVAQNGHQPGTISAETDSISGPSGGDPDTKDLPMAFGSDATLTIEVGSNLPKCSIILGHHVWGLTSESDEQYGGPYVGIGELPEHGSTLDGNEKDLCGLSGDGGGLLS